MGSLDTFRRDFELAQFASSIVRLACDGNLSEALRAKLAAQEDELKRLRRELEEMRMKSAAGGLDEALAGRRSQGRQSAGASRRQSRARPAAHAGRQPEAEGSAKAWSCSASAQPEGKVAIIAGVTPGLVKRIQAGKLVGAVAKLVGGSGGGKPEIAEAGGKDQAQIDAALAAAPGIVGDMLA